MKKIKLNKITMNANYCGLADENGKFTKEVYQSVPTEIIVEVVNEIIDYIRLLILILGIIIGIAIVQIFVL